MHVNQLDPREQDVRSPRNLEALFNPQSVVLVGASADRTKIGGRLLAHLLRYGYAGRLYVVNKSDAVVQGITAVPSIDDLPQDVQIDLAIVAVPAVHVPDAVEALAAAGVRVAVIVSSGFGETGVEGELLEARLRDVVENSPIRVLGPNCQGVANTESGLAASFSSVFGTTDGVLDGSTAVISQSGAMAAVLTQLALGHVDGVRYWAATGNELDLTVADVVESVVADTSIRVVQIYLENLSSPAVLVSAARSAIEQGTAILVLKSGTSADGVRAASSHTGALAQEDSIIDAFLTRHGMIRAREPREMSELARAFASAKRPAGNRVAMITNSGGIGVLLADGVEVNALAMAEFSAETSVQLRDSLPPFAAVQNPIDVTAQLLSRPELIREAIRAVEADPNVDIIVLALAILGSYYDLDQILADVVELDRRTDKVVVVCWVAGDAAMPARFAAAGIPTYDDTTSVMNALGKLVAHVRLVEQHQNSADITPPASADMAAAIPFSPGGPLSEYVGKEAVRSWGLPVVEGALAATPEEAVEAAEQIGYPVVLKVSAQGLAHKTELGLVQVGIGDPKTLQASAARMLRTAAKDGAVPGEIDGLLVEPLVADGLEMSVGVLRDPSVGSVVVLGAGGTETELHADVQLLIPPLTRESVHRAVRKLRLFPLLEGYRGAAPRDVESFVDFVVGVGNSAAVGAELIESLDINPVLVMPAGQGSVAVDVALTPSQSVTQPEAFA